MKEVGLRRLAQWRRLATSYRRIFSSVSSSYQPHFPGFDIFSSVTFSLSFFTFTFTFFSSDQPYITTFYLIFVCQFLFVPLLLSSSIAKHTWKEVAHRDKISDELTKFPYSGSFFIIHFLFSSLSLSLSSPLISHISPLFILFLSVSFPLSHFHFLRQLQRIYMEKSCAQWTRWTIPYSVFFSSATFSYTFTFHVSCCREGNLHFSETGVNV